MNTDVTQHPHSHQSHLEHTEAQQAVPWCSKDAIHVGSEFVELIGLEGLQQIIHMTAHITYGDAMQQGNRVDGIVWVVVQPRNTAWDLLGLFDSGSSDEVGGCVYYGAPSFANELGSSPVVVMC